MEYFISKVKERLDAEGKGMKEPNRQSWCSHIDKMLRIDKRSVIHIKAIIDWVVKDSFWQKNILSTDKLRQKFDMLVDRSNVTVSRPTGDLERLQHLNSKRHKVKLSRDEYQERIDLETKLRSKKS
jgi:hypothetical protein